MKIYNTTINQVVNLTIIDRRSGTEWTRDLIGNTGERLQYNEDHEMPEMDQDQYDWWLNTINGLDHIEDMKEEVSEVLSPEEFESVMEKLSQVGNADDLEYHIKESIGLLKTYLPY